MQVLEEQFALCLQPSLLGEARKLADEKEIALHQRVNIALTEKPAVLRKNSSLDEKASRADLSRALAILEKIGRGNKPVSGDEL